MYNEGHMPQIFMFHVTGSHIIIHVTTCGYRYNLGSVKNGLVLFAQGLFFFRRPPLKPTKSIYSHGHLFGPLYARVRARAGLLEVTG